MADIDRANILELIGGKRNANAITSLLTNFAEIFPDIDLGLDSNGNHMLALSYSADTLRESLSKLIKIERSVANEKILENMDEAIRASVESKKQENKERSNYLNNRSVIEKAESYIKKSIERLGNSEISDKEYRNAMRGISENVQKNILRNASGRTLIPSELLSKWNQMVNDFYNSGTIDWKKVIDSNAINDFVDNFIDNEINDLEIKAKSRSQKIANIANAYLQTSFDYETADNEMQTAISKIVSGIDFDSLDISNGDDLKQFIDNNIVKIIRKSTPEVKEAITDLFDLKSKLESGDLSASDYLNQIDTAVKTLKDNGASDSVVDSIKNIANYEQINKQLSEIEIKTRKTRDSLKDLSAEEIKIAYDIVKDRSSISIDDLIEQINIVKQQTSKPIEIKTNIESLSGIESLSEGFDQLSKIYTDIKDGGDFDWSSILNNEDFEKTFGNLGDDGKVYKDFVETIANSPNDINACQEAFNKLSSAYINNSGALDDVTESTRAGTVAMLKQMGVANAAEIVDKAIEINKIRLKYTTGEYTNKTYEQIKAQYDAAAAGSVEKQVLAELAIQKMLVNKNQIQTSSDITQLLNLANSANATAESLIRVSRAKAMLARAEEVDTKAQESVWYEEEIDTKGNTISVRHENGRDYQIAYERAANLRAEAQKLLDEGIDFNKFNIEDFVASSGGTGGSSSGGSGSSKETEPEIIDWIEVKINRIKENIDRLANKAKSSFKSITDRIKANMIITTDEFRDLMRWLNRPEFHRFQIIDDSEKFREPCYFNASFNIEKIFVADELYGLRLTMETDKPFGYGETQTVTKDIIQSDSKFKIYDISDEIGETYVDVGIVCKSDSDITITNEDIADNTMTISNCKNGELIHIDGSNLIITSSDNKHDICSDFNYEFLKIRNTYNIRLNNIAVNTPCKITVEYIPIIKNIPN